MSAVPPPNRPPPLKDMGPSRPPSTRSSPKKHPSPNRSAKGPPRSPRPPSPFSRPPASTVAASSGGVSRSESQISIQFEAQAPPPPTTRPPAQQQQHPPPSSPPPTSQLDNTLFVSPASDGGYPHSAPSPSPVARRRTTGTPSSPLFGDTSPQQVGVLEARLASLRGLYDTLDGHNDEVEAEYVRIRGILDNLRDGLIFTVRDELHMCRLELGHIRKSTAMELSAFGREMADTTRVVGRALAAAASSEDIPLFSPPRSPSRSEQASTVEHTIPLVYPTVVPPQQQPNAEMEDASFSSLVSSSDSGDTRHHHKGFRKVSVKRLSKVKHAAREWKRQLGVTLSDNAKLKAELRDRDTQFGRYLGELRSAHEEQIRTCQSHIHLLNSALRDVGSAVTTATSANPIDALNVDPKQQMIESAAVRLLKAIDDTHRLMSHAGVPPPTTHHLPHHDPSHHHLVDDDPIHHSGVHRTHSTASSTTGRRGARGGAHIISPVKRTFSSTKAPPADQSRWAKEVLDKHHHHKGTASKAHHTTKANRPFL